MLFSVLSRKCGLSWLRRFFNSASVRLFSASRRAASICAQRRLSLMAALRPAVRIMVETSRKMNIHLGGPMC